MDGVLGDGGGVVCVCGGGGACGDDGVQGGTGWHGRGGRALLGMRVLSHTHALTHAPRTHAHTHTPSASAGALLLLLPCFSQCTSATCSRCDTGRGTGMRARGLPACSATGPTCMLLQLGPGPTCTLHYSWALALPARSAVAACWGGMTVMVHPAWRLCDGACLCGVACRTHAARQEGPIRQESHAGPAGLFEGGGCCHGKQGVHAVGALLPTGFPLGFPLTGFSRSFCHLLCFSAVCTFGISVLHFPGWVPRLCCLASLAVALVSVRGVH